MRQFIYEREYVSPYSHAPGGFADPTLEVLKTRGAGGWELVAVTEQDSGGVRVFYFKKELDTHFLGAVDRMGEHRGP